MKLKKVMLIASAVMALSVFAVPTAAQASGSFWWTSTSDDPADDVKVGTGTSEGEDVWLLGEVSYTAVNGLVRLGPCLVEAKADLWNTATTGVGEVTNYSVWVPCPTNIPGCEIVKATAKDFPWPIDVTGDHAVDIGSTVLPANIAFTFNDGCTGLGIPPGVPLGGSGIATGTWNTGTHCIEFDKSGDLTGAFGPLTTDGELCPIGFDNTVTLHT